MDVLVFGGVVWYSCGWVWYLLGCCVVMVVVVMVVAMVVVCGGDVDGGWRVGSKIAHGASSLMI